MRSKKFSVALAAAFGGYMLALVVLAATVTLIK